MFVGVPLSPVLLAVTALLIACGAVRLRGTTLFAPALWALASILALCLVEVLSATGREPLRYAAAVTTLCPMMAVLGAKRPQDLAWQWVVLALLVTLWLPAAKGMLLDGSASLDLFLAWELFLAILVLLGPLNYLPTRNWLAVLLAAAGQSILLLPFLVTVHPQWKHGAMPLASTCFLAAAAAVWLRIWWRQSRLNESQSACDALARLNNAWLNFRDAFGAFWAVRVMQRVDEGLSSGAPALTLTWQGWITNPVAEEMSRQDFEASRSHAKRTLRTSLRRFVRRDAE